MSSPPKPDPEAHLVALCDRLDLEPVIRHMRQSKCLTKENAQLVRSHPTDPRKIEALVDLLISDERRLGFKLALLETDQTDLAELIDLPNGPTMTVSRSQPTLPSHSGAASAAQSSETTSTQAASSSQAEMLQLTQAELGALVRQHVQEALSCPGLVKAGSSASLGDLGDSGAHEAPSASAASDLRTANHSENPENHSEQSSVASPPTSQSEPKVVIQEAQAASNSSGFPNLGTLVSEIDLASSSAAPLPASQSEPDALTQQRVQEAKTSEARATGERAQQGPGAQEAAADGSFKPQIVITGGHEEQLIDVNSRQSVLLRMGRPRYKHSCVQISPGKLLLAGGQEWTEEPIPRCHTVTIQSSPSFSLSELDVSSLKRPVRHAALAAVGGGAYLAGGKGYNGGWLVSKLNKLTFFETACDNLWYFDGLKWSPRKTMPRPRYYFALLPLGEERLYAVGGAVAVGGGETAVDCYEVGRDQWHTLNGPGHNIYGNSAALIGRRIYALRNDETLDELDILDLDSGEWSEGPRLTKARDYPGLVSVGGRLVALGGEDGERSVEVLDLRAGRWETLEGFRLKMNCHSNNGAAFCTVDLD